MKTGDLWRLEKIYDTTTATGAATVTKAGTLLIKMRADPWVLGTI